ncbi:MAG: hypothetical protein ACKVVT_05020 [Dehalococcoidia bacterium]
MTIRAPFAAWLLILAAVLGPVLLFPDRARAEGPFAVLSDTYYKLDVPNGTATVRMEGEVLANSDLRSMWLYAMPKATGIVVTYDGAEIKTRTEPRIDSTGELVSTVVRFDLPATLKAGRRTKVEMTYSVPNQTQTYTRFEPGAIGSFFVHQGPGAFVFLDLPKTAENVVEPGCVLVAKQPSEVKDADMERWVCGETTLVALAGEDAKTLERCANLDDACRAKFLYYQSGYTQSITDQSKRGVMEGEVALQRGTVKVQLRYFTRSEAWAKSVFPVALEAMPKLEALFGFPYEHDTIVMKESYFIAVIGAAGIAFPSKGEVLLRHIPNQPQLDKEVTIHELAHQWAGHNLTRPWLWEGLAEYATRSLAPELGVKTRDWAWQNLPYKDPIATWYEGSEVFDSFYWYGKSGSFFLELEKAVGGREKMMAVLAAMDDDEARLPLDGRWFMDTSERLSGANLDELYLTWVFQRQTAEPLIRERRVAYDLLKPVAAKVADWGFVGWPTDVEANLRNWQFKPIAGQVQQMDTLTAEYVDLVDKIRGDELVVPVQTVVDTWSKGSLSDLERLLQDVRQSLDSIRTATTALANQPADDDARTRLDEARVKFSEGKLSEAKSLAAGSTTVRFNKDASSKMLALAKKTEQEFEPSFFKKIGLMWTDPAGDVAAAEAAFEAGEYGKSLQLSEAAYNTWTDAQGRGLWRLAVLSAGMCGITVGAWYLVKRLDPGRRRQRVQRRLTVDSKPKSSWRDLQKP